MIQISNIKISLDDNKDEALRKQIEKQIRTADFNYKITKESIDARKKPIILVYQVHVETENEDLIISKNKNLSKIENSPKEKILKGSEIIDGRVAVVGIGPSGLFAALELARNGYKPVVFERGKDVDGRKKDVELFWSEGKLDTESNVQFGEGGAGTFSDGKLTTRIKDKRVHWVLEDLYNFGASEEITYVQKPHIGTDVLINIVKSIREEIVRLGGQVKFNSKVEDLIIEDGRIKGLIVNGEEFKSNAVIMAIGHSARDTFKALLDRDVEMTSKPFAVGFRIEHPQVMIDKSQYKELYDHPKLKSAEYHLTNQSTTGRSCYTFCMCPGGKVIASSSEENMIVVNGMSYNARDLENANSAILCGVSTADFGDDVLAGIEFQREIERKAFVMGGGNYNAPIQRVEDFLNRRDSKEIGSVKPSYQPGYSFGRLDLIYPEIITESIIESISQMGKKLAGFDLNDAIVTGVETRSSSPVRILRGEEYQSINTQGLYPAGEGAGYAGGIISAAVDGLKAAEYLIKKFSDK
ncbi:MAG: hypothetical protein WBH44_04985 [Proteocatella sp.]